MRADFCVVSSRGFCIFSCIMLLYFIFVYCPVRLPRDEVMVWGGRDVKDAQEGALIFIVLR